MFDLDDDGLLYWIPALWNRMIRSDYLTKTGIIQMRLGLSINILWN